MIQNDQQEISKKVHASQENFQKGITFAQQGKFRMASFMFNLSARDTDELSEILKKNI